MYRLLQIALVASASLAPATALAAENAMTAMPATVIMCRDATSSEKPNAMMGSTALICKAVDTKTFMAGPDMTNVKTPVDATRAWKAFIQRTITTSL